MKRFLIGLLLSCCATPVWAQFTCANKPTCEDLGYVSETSAKCSEQAVLRCPLDLSYVFCGDDTVDLNCEAGDMLDVENRVCYEDDTPSDYVFIKYNALQTKAYVYDLTTVRTENVATYSDAIQDSSTRLLTRGMFSILAEAGVTNGAMFKCVCVRNGKRNEIVNRTNEVVDEASYASACNSQVTHLYYTKANLY